LLLIQPILPIYNQAAPQELLDTLETWTKCHKSNSCLIERIKTHRQTLLSSRRTSGAVPWHPEQKHPEIQSNSAMRPPSPIPSFQPMHSNFRRAHIRDYSGKDVTRFVHLRARQYRDSLRFGPAKTIRKFVTPAARFNVTTLLKDNGFARPTSGHRSRIHFENMHQNSSSQGLQDVREVKEKHI
jgi:hypothetical protein